MSYIKITFVKFLIANVLFGLYLIVVCNQVWNHKSTRHNCKSLKHIKTLILPLTVPQPSPSIIKTLRNFPFKRLMKAEFNNDRVSMDLLTEKLIADLTPYIILEPHTPINSSCIPPALSKFDDRGTSPKKVGVLLQFGFDVDTLEIHLNELYDIVDRFFILESTRTHSRAFRKPLVWELVRGQSRFSKFLDKVTHFVVDDADTALIRQTLLRSDEVSDWGAEEIQERLRWEKFVAWNNATNFFEDEDLLGFGDTDEIPSRDVIHRLKHSDHKTYPVDIGIWFPFGNINKAFRPDYTVGNHSYTLGDPTYWTLESAKKLQIQQDSNGSFPSRNRGASPSYLLGGMHMSHYGYLPLQIIKRISKTETNPESVFELIRLSETLNSTKVKTNLIYLEQKFAAVPYELLHRMVDLESIASEMEDIAILPWFYNCNRNRYPSWEERHDSRLD